MERLGWVSSGYAYLFMDTRGQGSAWGTGGGTPDPHGTGPSFSGFMTRGIDSPDEYYYRRVYTDAVRAIDAVRTFDRVDPDRVVVCGGSQGGGITLAAAALAEGVVAALPDVAVELDDRRRGSGRDRAVIRQPGRRYGVDPPKRGEERVFRTLRDVERTSSLAARCDGRGDSSGAHVLDGAADRLTRA